MAARSYVRSNESARSHCPSSVGEPEHVLLVIAGLIGDTVMSTPVVVELRRLYPDAHVTVLGRSRNAELLSACPYVDAFETIEVDPFALWKRKDLEKVRRWLVDETFDWGIIVLGDQFARLLADANIPIRVGVAGTPLEPCLTHSYDIGSARSWGPPERLRALACLGLPVRNVSPQLWVSDDSRRLAARKLATVGLDAEERYIVVHPYGSTRRQWWPVERIGALVGAFREETGLRTVLLGGVETVGQPSGPSGSSCLDARGILTLSELAAVLDRADLVISTDSGPFHIAGALQRPLVGLFRSSRPEHGVLYPTSRVLLGQDDECCGTCRWDHCERIPCQQMQWITVTEILESAVRSIRTQQ